MRGMDGRPFRNQKVIGGELIVDEGERLGEFGQGCQADRAAKTSKDLLASAWEEFRSTGQPYRRHRSGGPTGNRCRLF
jgi:hypothetical protein